MPKQCTASAERAIGGADARLHQAALLSRGPCPINRSRHTADVATVRPTQEEIPGFGYGLHREALDTDLSILGLFAGLFGTKAHMARHAGRATSPAKAAAARANGVKSGRPRLAAIG